MDTQKLLFGYKSQQKREIASLTKLMTLYTALEVCREHSLDPKMLQCVVSKYASTMNGTSANLKGGDKLTLYDLFHGKSRSDLAMMLPSGNDAAQSICENLGRFLAERDQGDSTAPPTQNHDSTANQPGASSVESQRSKALVRRDSVSLQTATGNPSQLVRQPSLLFQPAGAADQAKGGPRKKVNYNKCFLDRMNQLAESIGMSSSAFCNPHGLMNKHNHSTSHDIALLVNKALQVHSELFGRVVFTESYSTTLERDGAECEVEWKNTHKCFDDTRFLGGKTGITIAAGPCLASIMKLTSSKRIAIILLSCKAKFLLRRKHTGEDHRDKEDSRLGGSHNFPIGAN